MMTFSYRATDATGATRQGTIDAESAVAAAEALNEKGWTPIDVTPDAAEPFSFVTPQPLPTGGQDTQTPQLSQASQILPEGRQAPHPSKLYLPIAATLRLYAGWLLAYYALVYAVGWYAHSRPLPFDIPFVESLLLSPLVLSFTFAAFLFLIGHSVYRVLGAGLWRGIVVSAVGVGVFVVYRMNVV